MRRYVKLLPEAVVAELPFRLFKQNGASEGLVDRVRAPEGDTQVIICATSFPHFQSTNSACKFFPLSKLLSSLFVECLFYVAILVCLVRR